MIKITAGEAAAQHRAAADRLDGLRAAAGTSQAGSGGWDWEVYGEREDEAEALLGTLLACAAPLADLLRFNAQIIDELPTRDMELWQAEIRLAQAVLGVKSA